jgi:hypothetical protein
MDAKIGGRSRRGIKKAVGSGQSGVEWGDFTTEDTEDTEHREDCGRSGAETSIVDAGN